MAIIQKIVCFLSVFQINIADENCGFCPLKPQFYYELQCSSVRLTGQRCATRYIGFSKIFLLHFLNYLFIRYACPNFGAFNSSQCYYHGTYYNIGEIIPDELAPACKVGCYCDMYFKTYNFNLITNLKNILFFVKAKKQSKIRLS